MSNQAIQISYFSDVLCVWAYVAQIRLEELKTKFQDKIEITPYHVTLFGDTEKRIGEGWKNKGGFDGFNQHVLHVCEDFPHLNINPNIWKTVRPKSSGMAHLFLKAVQLTSDPKISTANDEQLKKIEWDIRLAFFQDARDIADMNVLYDIAAQYKLSKERVNEQLNNGAAMALFCSEIAMREEYKLEGSPTYLLNQNRQKLFGNVGYKIMEANVTELLCDQGAKQASWC